jgi:hypothetical protein
MKLEKGIKKKLEEMVWMLNSESSKDYHHNRGNNEVEGRIRGRNEAISYINKIFKTDFEGYTAFKDPL